MNYKRPPILLATDNNGLKNKLLEKLLKLKAHATCVSASQLATNPEQYLFNQPTILILDVGKDKTFTQTKHIRALATQEYLRIILLADTKIIHELDHSDGSYLETSLTIISTDPPLREIVLALNYCSALIATQNTEKEQKREHWVQKALAGLYQRTEEPSAILAGIMGITATALNLQCAVVTMENEHNLASIISHSGSKSDRLELSWKRLPRSNFKSELSSRFIHLKEISSGSFPSITEKKNLFAPTSGLLTRISRQGPTPIIFCALGEPDRMFHDYEKRIFMQSAVLASVTLELTIKPHTPDRRESAPQVLSHQREL